MNKQIIFTLLIAAALAWAGFELQDREAELQRELARVTQERQELAGQVDRLSKDLRELKESHELYIAVSQDLDDRLARVEGGKR